jgi:hypothetical protein
MAGEKLRVEEVEAAGAQARNQVGEGDLRGVAGAAEHALAEEGRAQPHAVEATDKFAVAPAFD